MSAQAGWYPDPGGGQDLFRYWDGRAWSAATSPTPAPRRLPRDCPAAPPAAGRRLTPYGRAGGANQPPYGQGGGYGAYGQLRPGSGHRHAYAHYQQLARKKSPVGWWLAAAALLVVIVVVAVLAVRAVTGAPATSPACPGGRAARTPAPAESGPSVGPIPDPGGRPDARGSAVDPRPSPPWGAPKPEIRVPFGTDAKVPERAGPGGLRRPHSLWVASVLVAELQAGDGFFSPEQGSQIVVRCILGTFYGDSAVTSDVKVNEAATIDGHEAWVVESPLTFDIPGLKAKGERLIVAIVSAGTRRGSTTPRSRTPGPDLVKPARDLIDAARGHRVARCVPSLPMRTELVEGQDLRALACGRACEGQNQKAPACGLSLSKAKTKALRQAQGTSAAPRPSSSTAKIKALRQAQGTSAELGHIGSHPARARRRPR